MELRCGGWVRRSPCGFGGGLVRVNGVEVGGLWVLRAGVVVLVGMLLAGVGVVMKGRLLWGCV